MLLCPVFRARADILVIAESLDLADPKGYQAIQVSQVFRDTPDSREHILDSADGVVRLDILHRQEKVDILVQEVL